jgi:hypothetical protein
VNCNCHGWIDYAFLTATYHVSLLVMYLVTTKEDACNVVLYCFFDLSSNTAVEFH